MSARIHSKIRWSRSLALLLALCSPSLADDRAVRLFFNFEAQAFSIRSEGQTVEALVLRGGQVERRATGPVSREFHEALLAIERRFAGRNERLSVTRESLAGRNFFFLSHPRFRVTGRAADGAAEVAALRAAARALAFALPEADRGGLYALSFPASAPGPREEAISAAAIPGDSPLRAAMGTPGFPLRVSPDAPPDALPRHSVFGVAGAGGEIWLLSYFAGPPFSLPAWLER